MALPETPLQSPHSRKSSRLKWMALGAGATVAVIVVLVAAITLTHRVRVASGPPPFGPRLPVTITFREALLSRGAVAQVSNYSNSPLEQVTAVCTNTALQKSHQFAFQVLDAHHSVKIGWREGWDFTPGDTLTVQSPGYASCSAILNK